MVGVDSSAIMDVESCSSGRNTPSSSNAGGSMAVETRDFEEHLFSGDEDKCYSAVLQLKGTLIGSNRQKHLVIERGFLPRIIHLLGDDKTPARLRIAAAQTLGSVAKGMDAHVKALIDSGAVPVLLNGIIAPPPELVESCLRCLKTLFAHPDAPVEYLYADANIIPHLLALMPHTVSTQISVCTLLTHACKTREHQNALAGFGAHTAISSLLKSPYVDVQVPALKLLAFLIFGNEHVAALIAQERSFDESLIDTVVRLMDRQRPPEMQLEAARCLTYMYRCGQLTEEDARIVYKALPCVVRLTREEESVETRILAAETLAFLIELSAELQRIAAISNHLIKTISSFLWWEPEVSDAPAYLAMLEEDKTASGHGKSCLCLDPQKTSGLTKYQMLQLTKKLDQEAVYSLDIKKAAFRVFASLAANDEDIRKRIIETDRLMDSLVSALQEGTPPKLQMAAVGCLHSLSRSVQLLRTSFQDYPVWKPLMKILSSPGSGSVDFLVVASSTLCNLLLEFSPSKEPILDSGAIELLCQLTHKYDSALVLNGVWGLMNMSFGADQRLKIQIITTLGSDRIFRLLSDQDISVIMKTLGLLRNLLSRKSDIDHVMSLYGKQVMQAVVFILEGDNVVEVKEQALCILANIADGDTAKNFIMSNEDVLKKITNYIIHTSPKLQMAAVLCVFNLTYSEDQGAPERQNKLKDIGVYGILQQLRNTSDSALSEQVKNALNQFT